jgi:hypothetical protein
MGMLFMALVINDPNEFEEKRLENTDQYAFQKDQEPLYKVVPFYWVTK